MILKAAEFASICEGKIVNIESTGVSSTNFLVRDEDDPNKIVLISLNDVQIIETANLENNYPIPIVITGNSTFQDIHITGKLDDLTIEGNTSIRNIKFTDSNATFLDIRGECKVKELRFSQGSYASSIYINEKAEVQNLYLFDSSISNSIAITGESLVNVILFNNSAGAESLALSGESKCHTIDIDSDIHLESLYFSESNNTRYVNLKYQCKVDRVTFDDDSRIMSFEVSDEVEIGRFEFNGGEVYRNFSFTNWSSNQLLFKGPATNFSYNITTLNVRVNAIRFVDFYARSIRLVDVKALDDDKPKFIEFTRSKIDELDLAGVKTEEYKFLVFEDSNILNTFSSTGYFPKLIKVKKWTEMPEFSRSLQDEDVRPKNEIIKIKIEDKKYDYRQQKLFSEQMKVAMSKQGNSSERLKYQADEQNALYDQTEWFKNFYDKLTLFINKHTNRYGTSWVRSLAVLLISSVILYTLVLWVASDRQLKAAEFNDYVLNYFDFINPTSFIWKEWKYIKGLGANANEINISTKVTILFSKVIIFTIIYQLVQAFRKFGKR